MEQRRRFWTVGVVVAAVAVAGCSGGSGSGTVGSSSSSVGPSGEGSTSGAGGVVRLPRVGPVAGEAPVRLEDPAAPAVYLEYAGSVGGPVGPPPAAGLQVRLAGCTVAGPGVVVYDVEVGGEGVSYPVRVGVEAALALGDVVTGTEGVATFAGPGRYLVVSAMSDQLGALEANGYVDRRLSAGGGEVARRGPGYESAQCGLGLGSDHTFPGGWVEAVPQAVGLEVTAPPGTVEALAQGIFGDGDGAALWPLAVAYGKREAFYADRWFLPADPARLDSIRESLSAGGCLTDLFTYAGYTVTQRLRCPEPADTGVHQDEAGWVASAGDGVWLVQVTAGSRETAVSVAESLHPFWHLFHRDVPLIPVGETEVGRGTYQGDEVLVTVGDQRCSGECQGPERWFFLYRIARGHLEEFADYPAYDECLLAEESFFVVAVAPPGGSILVRRGTGTTVVADPARPPFVFVDTSGEPVTVTMVDQAGNPPRCIGLRANDPRGGIEPAPTTQTGR